jgi:signal transduction histidine kinase
MQRSCDVKFPSKNRFFWPAAIIVLTFVLIALAMMQYHWSLAISEAATARMKANLANSMTGFRQDFYRELENLIADTQSDHIQPAELARYAAALQQWHRSAENAGLVKSVYLWDGTTQRPKVSQLSLNTGRFDAVDAPPPFPILENESFFHMRFRGSGPMPFRHEQGMMMMRHEALGGPSRRPGALWIVDATIPALLRPIDDELPRDRKQPNIASRWVVIELDREFLRQHFFPQLAARYFSGANGLAYDVEVVAEGRQRQQLYSSGGTLASNGDAAADASIHLFGPPGPPQGDMGFALITRGARPQTSSLEPPDAAVRDPLEAARFVTAGGDWRLMVKNKQGSMEAVVAAFRRKHLAMSSGVLLVLALTMGIVVLAGRRAQRLADLQMEFVAGVSHELRTPLAVIASAADNIFDGVVEERVQLERYAAVIKSQAKQLTHLVEQILLFATAREKKQRFKMRRLQISELIDAVIGSTSEMTRSAGCPIEKDIQPDLPQVMGDFDALLHCLQNLIVNAVKYGGEGRWVGLRAHVRSGKEVEITVEDKGAGIATAELSKIFDPFYRSPSVIAAQIHGTGLGLPLARSVAEAMGGRLTVSSQIGKGSAFTLHLPVVTQAEKAVIRSADGSGHGQHTEDLSKLMESGAGNGNSNVVRSV